MSGWWDFVASEAVSCAHSIRAISTIVMARAASHNVPEKTGIANPERPSLVVLLHGLNGRPADMRDHCQALRAEHAIHCPHVRRGGNCPLDSAADPVFDVVSRHIGRHGPTAPVALIGVSNGGRIAARVECMLRRRYPSNPVFLSAVATPFHGTHVLDWLGDLAHFACIYGQAPVEEMRYDSMRSRRLVQDLRKAHDGGPRRYLFFAAAKDMLVRPLASALPRIDKGEEHVVVPEHGHMSVLLAVRQRQCDEWRGFLAQLAK